MPSIIGFSWKSSSSSSSSAAAVFLSSIFFSSLFLSSSTSISSIPLGTVVEISHFGIVPGCCPSILPLSFLFSFSRSLIANFFSYSLSFTAKSRNFGCTSSTNVASNRNILSNASLARGNSLIFSKASARRNNAFGNVFFDRSKLTSACSNASFALFVFRKQADKFA